MPSWRSAGCWPRRPGGGNADPAAVAGGAQGPKRSCEALKAEIERITREVSREQVERDRLTRDLQARKLSVGQARDA